MNCVCKLTNSTIGYNWLSLFLFGREWSLAFSFLLPWEMVTTIVGNRVKDEDGAKSSQQPLCTILYFDAFVSQPTSLRLIQGVWWAKRNYQLDPSRITRGTWHRCSDDKGFVDQNWSKQLKRRGYHYFLSVAALFDNRPALPWTLPCTLPCPVHTLNQRNKQLSLISGSHALCVQPGRRGPFLCWFTEGESQATESFFTPLTDTTPFTKDSKDEHPRGHRTSTSLSLTETLGKRTGTTLDQQWRKPTLTSSPLVL